MTAAGRGGPGDQPLPLLGLALTRRPPAAALPLLVALHEWCLPATLDPAAGRPDAVLATPEGLHLSPPDTRVALWAEHDDITSEAFRTAAVIISDDEAVVEAAGTRGLRAPTGRHLGKRRPMSPFVRTRLRRERGLARNAVLEQREGEWRFGVPGRASTIAPELVETAMGTAVAVVVTDPGWLLRSLAWAAPTVTTEAAAEQIGARPDVEVLTGGTAAARVQAAAALALDEPHASRLSWRGYRRVERLDADRAAVELVDRLGLWPEQPTAGPTAALPTVEVALRLLGTPGDAHVRSRLQDAGARLTLEP
jgi:hypothetical protein